MDPKKEAEEAENARYEAKRAQMRKAQAEHDEILAKFQKQAHESDLQEQKKQQEQLQKQQHDLRQQQLPSDEAAQRGHPWYKLATGCLPILDLCVYHGVVGLVCFSITRREKTAHEHFGVLRLLHVAAQKQCFLITFPIQTRLVFRWILSK